MTDHKRKKKHHLFYALFFFLRSGTPAEVLVDLYMFRAYIYYMNNARLLRIIIR